MYRVVACLTGQHDLVLVGLAAVICVLSAFMAFWLVPSAQHRQGTRRWLLTGLAGLCVGTGIWATHFVAMLAYDGGMPTGFDIPVTALSLVIAVAMTTLGAAVLASPRKLTASLAGGVIGLGIASMHFTGMRAVIAAGHQTWDTQLVAASVLAGVVISCAATWAFASLKGWAGRIVAPLLLTVAICSMHFTAMGAVTLVPDPTVAVSISSLSHSTLASIIAIVTLFVLLFGIVGAALDRFSISRGMVAFGGSIVVTLIATIGVGFYSFEQVRIGGHNFSRVSAAKDLIADILPPPAYIIEAYLEARIAHAEPDQLPQRKARLEELRRDYLARKAHWQASTLVPPALRDRLVRDSDAEVQRFWHVLDTSFLPALQRGDAVAGATAMAELSEAYRAHRRIVEDIVRGTNAYSDNVEHTVTSNVGLLRNLAIGAVALLLLVIAASLLAIARLVVRPVLNTEAYLTTLAAGNYSEPVPYVTREDEIGIMAKSIEKLRQASIEKLRLEAEAADTRLARDKERAAEALRLRMANESITGLHEDLKLAFEQLRQAQDENVRKGKLAQLGQLTATVAHEIRNPLGAVKTAIYLIDRKTKDKSLGIEPQMQRINNGIARCDTIITELLDFTRTKALATSPQPVDQWVSAVVEEERRSLPQEVAISMSLEAGAQPALFDTGRMRRVLINLLSNAAEAMVGKPGEKIESATQDPIIKVTTRVVDGNVEIVVADNGPGISPENIARIREPLFTTKSFGVGLGLPAVENILEQHGGGLRIVSEVGHGATMTAWFPFRPAQSQHVDNHERKVA